MKIYWCGPTMGKTYAAKLNSNIIDFDDVARNSFELLALKLNISIRELKMTMPTEYHKLFIQLINELQNVNSNKIVLVSNAIGLQYHLLFEKLLIPSCDVFIKRNIQRGGCKTESENWYNDLMHKHNAMNLCQIENKFVSEIL